MRRREGGREGGRRTAIEKANLEDVFGENGGPGVVEVIQWRLTQRPSPT